MIEVSYFKEKDIIGRELFLVITLAVFMFYSFDKYAFIAFVSVVAIFVWVMLVWQTDTLYYKVERHKKRISRAEYMKANGGKK